MGGARTIPELICGACKNTACVAVRDYGGMRARLCSLCDALLRSQVSGLFAVPVVIEAEVSARFADIREVA